LSLSTLPNLKELIIDLPYEENVKDLLKYLPNLKMLNGKSLNQNSSSLTTIDLLDEQIKEATFETEIPNYNVKINILI
jgi:hypothetical protein